MMQCKKKTPFSVRYAVGLLLGLALISYAIVASAPKEPVYQGKTLDEWLAKIPQGNPYIYTGARGMKSDQEAIRAIGAKALPFALADIAAHETMTEKGVNWLAGHARFPKLQPRLIKARWERGITTLEILGPIAEPCLPELIANASQNPGYSERALMAVGPAAIPAFTNLLSKAKAPQRAELIAAFEIELESGRIAPAEAAAALPCLILDYHNEAPYVRARIARAIGAIHQQPELCAPLLVEGLSDPDSVTSTACLDSLVAFGEVASAHVAEIAAAYDSRSDSLRMLVCQTLARFRSAGSVAVPTLVLGLQDQSASVRLVSAQSLGQLATLPEQAVPALEKALRDSAPDVRRMGAESLGRFGPRAARAIPALEQSCGDANASVCRAAVRALRLIKDEGPEQQP
jgi:HEAT repeat protein